MPLQGKHCRLSNAPAKFRTAFASVLSRGMVSATTATQLFAVPSGWLPLSSHETPCCYKELFFLLLTLFPTALEQNAIYCGVVTQLHNAVHLISVHRTVISSTKPKLFIKGDIMSLSLCCLKRWQQMSFHGIDIC